MDENTKAAFRAAVREILEINQMNQLEAFVANLELSLKRRYDQCNDSAATPSSILLAVLNAVADAKSHMHDQCSSPTTRGDQNG